MVKVRGRNSNRKTVKHMVKNWQVRAFVTSWCHAGATSESCKVTQLVQGIRNQQEWTRVEWWQMITRYRCWHDNDCDRHRDAVQSWCFEPWPSVTEFSQLSSGQAALVDCSSRVFLSVSWLKLRWTLKSMLSLLSNFWSRTRYRFDHIRAYDFGVHLSA